jgi:hypothetical protein
MSSRTKVLELGYEIAEIGTPIRCKGCDKPNGIGYKLAVLVLNGEIYKTEAAIALCNELDTTCSDGLGILNDVDLGDDRKCGYPCEPNVIIN